MDNHKSDTHNPAPFIEAVGRLAVPCEIYSRVSGYFRPVNQWNAGKRSEFNDRKLAHITADTIKGSRFDITI